MSGRDQPQTRRSLSLDGVVYDQATRLAAMENLSIPQLIAKLVTAKAKAVGIEATPIAEIESRRRQSPTFEAPGTGVQRAKATRPAKVPRPAKVAKNDAPPVQDAAPAPSQDDVGDNDSESTMPARPAPTKSKPLPPTVPVAEDPGTIRGGGITEF